jgi:hypothetical protein
MVTKQKKHPEFRLTSEGYMVKNADMRQTHKKGSRRTTRR